jgi:hypothetical protein
VVEYRAREVSKREHREQFKELILLQTRGSELCHAIVGTPRARHHLSEGMQLAALHHSEMVGGLATLWAAVLLPHSRCLGARPVIPSVWR